jgi:hypothetical protein
VREGVFDVIGERNSGGWLLGFDDLVEIVVGNSDWNFGLAVWDPEFRSVSPKKSLN